MLINQQMLNKFVKINFEISSAFNNENARKYFCFSHSTRFPLSHHHRYPTCDSFLSLYFSCILCCLYVMCVCSLLSFFVLKKRNKILNCHTLRHFIFPFVYHLASLSFTSSTSREKRRLFSSSSHDRLS